MSRPEVHVANIRQEIAMLTQDGHIVDFEEIGCIGSIEYELQNYLRIQDEKNERKV